MFAALTVVRLREAVTEAGLGEVRGWVSPDGAVEATELPLARAVERVVGGMQGVLEKTVRARDRELERVKGVETVMGERKGGESAGGEEGEKRMHLQRTKAAEVRVTRCLGDLRDPVVEWKAVALEE